MEEQVNIKAMIVAELKEQGLEIGEEMAIAAVKVILGLVPKIVIATENKIDDLLLALLPIIEPKIMEALDKIDGEEG